jgi:hypothetical protein
VNLKGIISELGGLLNSEHAAGIINGNERTLVVDLMNSAPEDVWGSFEGMKATKLGLGWGSDGSVSRRVPLAS